MLTFFIFIFWRPSFPQHEIRDSLAPKLYVAHSSLHTPTLHDCTQIQQESKEPQLGHPCYTGVAKSHLTVNQNLLITRGILLFNLNKNLKQKIYNKRYKRRGDFNSQHSINKHLYSERINKIEYLRLIDNVMQG